MIWKYLVVFFSSGWNPYAGIVSARALVDNPWHAFWLTTFGAVFSLLGWVLVIHFMLKSYKQNRWLEKYRSHPKAVYFVSLYGPLGAGISIFVPGLVVPIMVICIAAKIRYWWLLSMVLMTIIKLGLITSVIYGLV